MTRVFLHALKSYKQLKKCSYERVVSAGFVDEKENFFEVTFDIGNGKRQDLVIVFETRTPRIYISDLYV